MAQFSTINLVDNKVLVSGTDATGETGQVILDGTQWAELTAKVKHEQAHDDFDTAVEEFFAPLLQAADKLEATAVINEDPISFIDFGQDIDPTPAQRSTRVHLTRDSIILRLIENRDFERLIWVGEKLEILAADSMLPGFGEDPGDVTGFADEAVDSYN